MGCLEAEASGWAIVRDAERALQEGATGVLANVVARGEPITPEAVSIAAQDGDALAISLVQRSARLIGESIAALVNMFNPGVIVVGGALSAAGELFLAEVRQRVYELSLPLATRDLSIVRSVGRRAGAVARRRGTGDRGAVRGDLPAVVRGRPPEHRGDQSGGRMIPILGDDALIATADGFDVRLRLPWIRSLPLSSVSRVQVAPRR